VADKRLLAPFNEPTEVYGVLCPDSGPAVVGNGGIDWHCYQCDSLLLQGMHEREIIDLLVRCYSCGVTAATPQREAGEPLAGRPVLLPPGRYRLSSQVSATDQPVMLVGIQALNGYIKETGLEPLSDAGRITLGQSEFSAGLLRTLASEASALLGDRFAHLKAADERGRSSPTPPASRHRLIELIDYAAATATDLDQGCRIVNGDYLSELFTCISLFTRWRNHPAYSHLRKTLADGQEVQHTIMLLAVASYLVDAGNGVGIVFRQSDQRIPDLWLTPSVTERLNLEVKTPTELRGPRKTTITNSEADKLISRLLKKAASSGSGQLDQRHSGTLAIGGFHLGSRSFDTLVRAATRVLASQSSRKNHLAALLIMELSYQTTTVINQTAGPDHATFQPVLRAELIKHPGYRGGLEIRSNAAPWTTIAKAE
jgi:hypothetical protein